MVRRFMYLLYYLREFNLMYFRKMLSYASGVSGRSKLSVVADSVYSVFRFNTSFKDYFCFRFFQLSKPERSEWAGTGFMYEYQLKMNPYDRRTVLINKIDFNRRFYPYLKREYASFEILKNNFEKAEKLLNNSSGRLVLKNSTGQAGRQIKVLDCRDISLENLLQNMSEGKYDLAEEYVVQHPEMMKLSPSGLNTVRVITQENRGMIEIVATRLRVSVDSPVDNMAAGNAAAPIDINTGMVTGPAVFSDITKNDLYVHPVTGTQIPGFIIPFWAEIITLTRNAAMMIPENRSIGWDVAVSSTGPLLIEGNHNWCKLLWQLPVKKGLKKELEKYL